MNYKQNFDLYGCNTMRLHSIARDYYEPESTEELQDLVQQLTNEKREYYILGAGSNVILPPKINRVIIGTGLLNNEITINEHKVICGASVRIQKLIRTCQKASIGGLEFLFSVPCFLGGAVYMNAGAGTKVSIADFIVSVKYFDPETNSIKVINKDDADFSYRHSIFQSKQWVILCVELNLVESTFEEIEKRIQARLDFSHEKLDAGKPSCGSVFNVYNSRIIDLLKGLKIGGACYSKKKSNWISNINNASYFDIKALIRVSEFLHHITFKPIHREIIIVKK